jgi:hypothetical protein
MKKKIPKVLPPMPPLEEEKPKYVRPPDPVPTTKATHACKACGRPMKSQHENCAKCREKSL